MGLLIAAERTGLPDDLVAHGAAPALPPPYHLHDLAIAPAEHDIPGSGHERDRPVALADGSAATAATPVASGEWAYRVVLEEAGPGSLAERRLAAHLLVDGSTAGTLHLEGPAKPTDAPAGARLVFAVPAFDPAMRLQVRVDVA